MSGPITPTLYVSSDAKDTDFTVKVLDVYPDGRAYNLDESIQRMRYRDGYDKPLAWMESGKVYKVTLQPLTTSNYFAAGTPAARRSVEQQLSALRSQPEHRRQQLRREQGRRRAQRACTTRSSTRRSDGDGRQEIRAVNGGTGEVGRDGLERQDRLDATTGVLPAHPAHPALQCSEKRDQRVLVFRRQRQSECVSGDCAGLGVRRIPALRPIVVAQPGRIEPLLERCDRS